MAQSDSSDGVTNRHVIIGYKPPSACLPLFAEILDSRFRAAPQSPLDFEANVHWEKEVGYP